MMILAALGTGMSFGMTDAQYKDALGEVVTVNSPARWHYGINPDKAAPQVEKWIAANPPATSAQTLTAARWRVLLGGMNADAKMFDMGYAALRAETNAAARAVQWELVTEFVDRLRPATAVAARRNACTTLERLLAENASDFSPVLTAEAQAVLGVKLVEITRSRAEAKWDAHLAAVKASGANGTVVSRKVGKLVNGLFAIGREEARKEHEANRAFFKGDVEADYLLAAASAAKEATDRADFDRTLAAIAALPMEDRVRPHVAALRQLNAFDAPAARQLVDQALADTSLAPSARVAYLDAKIAVYTPNANEYHFNEPGLYPVWRASVRERLAIAEPSAGYYAQWARLAVSFDDLKFADELTEKGLAKLPKEKTLHDLRAQMKVIAGDVAGAVPELVLAGREDVANFLKDGKLASGTGLDAARAVSRWLFNARRYDDCRAIQSFVEANLLRPFEPKVHKVVFDVDAPRSAEGFARSKYYDDWDSMETRFEKYGKEYHLRKKTDHERLLKTAEEPAIDPAYRTGLKAIADAVGVHVFIRGNDPKIDEVNLFQRENAGGLECLFEPGDHDKPYRSIFFSGLPGTFDRACVEWSMPTRDYRASSEAVFKDAVLTKEGFVAHVYLPWIAYYDSLPVNGRSWLFGVDRTGPMGDYCTGGLSHGISHGVRLKFDLTSAQLAMLRRRVALAAYNRYKKLRNDPNGFILRWTDPDLGDPAFFKEKVTPLLAELDKAGEELTKPCDDGELDRICRDFVPRWAEIDFELSDLRIVYLDE